MLDSEIFGCSAVFPVSSLGQLLFHGHDVWADIFQCVVECLCILRQMKCVCTFPRTFSNNEFNSLGPVLEKNPVFCGNLFFLHCEEILLAAVDMYSVFCQFRDLWSGH